MISETDWRLHGQFLQEKNRSGLESAREENYIDMNPAEMSLRLLLCSRLSDDQRRLAEHYARTDSGTGHEKN